MMTTNKQPLPIALAMTGASGACYGLRLLQCLLAADYPVYFLISKAALLVMATETQLSLPSKPRALEAKLGEMYQAKRGQLQVFGREQWTAPVASGSAPLGAMVICPCSVGALSAIACGASNNLIERAADVVIKEKRRLILVPRETPFSAIHLENMLKLARLGVTILPANPGFYQQPQSMEDLVDFVVARILNQLGIAHTLSVPWGKSDESGEISVT